MTEFICPICKRTLKKEPSLYRCEAGHSFDRAKSGYVNLLTPDKMNSKEPGDGKEMVSSRKDFLLKGYYEPLSDKLAELAKKYVSSETPVYLDAGCGTGYYMRSVKNALEAKSFGIDISKYAVNASAKEDKTSDFGVASVYDLPLPDESVDLITNVFSPMAASEYQRVLKKGGHLLYVVPAPRHLLALKTLLYENQYLNKEEDVVYDGLTEKEKVHLDFELNLSSPEDILSLFKMTPYFWRTPFGAEEKIKSTKRLTDRASFYVLVLEK